MAGCAHGVPGGFCAICNGLRLHEDPEFIPPKERLDPHIFKGRDKAEWRGRGESTGEQGSDLRVRAAAIDNGPRLGQCRSSWADANIMRSFHDRFGHNEDFERNLGRLGGTVIRHPVAPPANREMSFSGHKIEGQKGHITHTTPPREGIDPRTGKACAEVGKSRYAGRTAQARHHFGYGADRTRER